MTLRRLLPVAVSLVVLSAIARADVKLNPLFSPHAVLQQQKAITIWGTADTGEVVTVELAGKKRKTTAHHGHWHVDLPSLPAGGPYTLTVHGKNIVNISDILIGEVWVASGQSNMEFPMGPQPWTEPLVGGEKAIAEANFPQIREFHVGKKISPTPVHEVVGDWAVCSPETVVKFSAVAFYFARNLHLDRHVPIGIIHTSWGGTPAEAWTRREALDQLPFYKDALAQEDESFRDPSGSAAKYQSYLDQWYQLHDRGTGAGPNVTATSWSDPNFDDHAWTEANQPGAWEDSGMPGFDGVVWLRREFMLPADWKNDSAELSLGPIDDADTTWINGQRVGATAGYDVPRHYAVPAGLLKPGVNQITVRVLDTGGNGGFIGTANQLFIKGAGSNDPAISLAGSWKRAPSLSFENSPKPREQVTAVPGAPSVLFNGMLYPLIPYTIRGVIWYQGEANAGRANEYQKLFPAMIADWRKLWRLGEFPFLFVQIAPFESMSPEIREAQLLTLDRVPKTAMAVTIDVGSAHNIHPGNKQPVGDRLALAARALAYHEHIEYSGPLFEDAKFHDGQATIAFTHVGGGLAVKGNALAGFTLAGTDGVFHPAKAVIEGKKLLVTADGVGKAAAVRYAWDNVPIGNLYNVEGLPASPFRSDVEKIK